MKRREFLKLGAISTAGLIVPFSFRDNGIKEISVGYITAIEKSIKMVRIFDFNSGKYYNVQNPLILLNGFKETYKKWKFSDLVIGLVVRVTDYNYLLRTPKIKIIGSAFHV